MIRDGASIDSFVGDCGSFSLEDSEYERGVRIGSWFETVTAKYNMMLPYWSHPSGNEITYLAIQMTGTRSINFPNSSISVGGFSGIMDDEWSCRFHNGDIPMVLQTSSDGFGSYLSLEVEVPFGAFFFDVDRIMVVYYYDGVDAEDLRMYQEFYSAWKCFEAYRDVVSAWDSVEVASEYFYSACQESLALADNLDRLSSSNLKDALDATTECIENFQTLAGLIEWGVDNLEFRTEYDFFNGPDFSDVLAKLRNVEDSLRSFVLAIYTCTFDGDVSIYDSGVLTAKIDDVRFCVSEFEDILEDVAGALGMIILSDGDGVDTATVMFYSLSPMFSPVIGESFASVEPKYTSALVEILDAMSYEVYCNPDVSRDGDVDLRDFAVLANRWLDFCVEPDWCSFSDIDFSGRVDERDLMILSSSWLMGE